MDSTTGTDLGGVTTGPGIWTRRREDSPGNLKRFLIVGTTIAYVLNGVPYLRRGSSEASPVWSGNRSPHGAELAKEPYDRLASRPPREQIALPDGLRGIKCFIHRRPGERGGVEIAVEIRQRVLLILLTSSEGGFEVFPDGKVVPV